MTRSKVLDEQRKRIGQACKGCQTRKQKCDGQLPCSGCEKRGHLCTYDPLRKRKSVTRMPKQDGGILPSSKGLSSPFSLQKAKLESGNSPPLRSPLGGNFLHHGSYESPSAMSEWSNAPDVPLDRCESSAAATRVSSQSSVYICGSSSASFIAEVKKLVLPLSGPCIFTQSHDNLTKLGSNARPQMLPKAVALPDRVMAEHLVKLAGQYSNHLVELLDESTIKELLQTCYSKPHEQEPGSLCLLYLLFAAGSVILEAQKNTDYSHPVPCSVETAVKSEEYFEFAEATLMRFGGYENYEVWMIQAWALMTVYSLAASKLNAADVYIGLAVRAADVLGINHPPGATSRAPADGKANALHAKLWKCLYVLDSVVAALLGRQPHTLKEDKTKPTVPADCSPSSPVGRDGCLEFNVASAKTIRKALKLVYNQRHFPAEKASSMLQQAQLYAPPNLAYLGNQDGVDHLATQHAVLFRHYTAMVLSRPFLIQELSQLSKMKYLERSDTTWKYLSETCIVIAHQAVERTSEALDQCRHFQNDYMWRPCLFTALLVILTNRIFDFFEYPNSEAIIARAFEILDIRSARNPTEESELSSLHALRRLVEDRKRRSLPMGRPAYLDMAPPYAGYDVHGDNRTSPIFPLHDFAAACADSTYCDSDGCRYSVQSMPSPDYMESVAASAGVTPLTTTTATAWSSGPIPSINLPRCGSDAGCYSFAVQQDGYDGDAMQVTQDYTAYTGQQLYLS
ncbi:hypothetical protein MY5147_000237 [Beauveria neobassiana]